MIRRVVAGHKGGKSVFLSDGEPARVDIFEKTPGLVSALVAATPAHVVIGNQESPTANTDDIIPIPSLGETRLNFITVPPLSVMLDPAFDPVAAGEEFARLQPEMATLHEPDAPGMHRTETVDYIIVLDGEVEFEVDDGQIVSLKTHDVVVQYGTRHAWRNRSDKPVLLAVFLIGAVRSDKAS